MTSRPPSLNLVRRYWRHDPAAVASSSEQESDSLDEPNVASDQVHLVLTRNELALVVSGLRQYGKLPLFERLERILTNLPR
jgi:hypothetical protein